jgi:Domain of unknown function (DUF4158)
VFTISVAVHLVLQLGYFKAKRQFLVYELGSIMEDADHILQRYFPARERAEIKSPSRSTRLEQQQTILKLCDGLDTALDHLGSTDDDPALHGQSTGPLCIFHEELSRSLWSRNGDEIATLEAQNQHFKTGGKDISLRISFCADGSRRELLAIMLGDRIFAAMRIDEISECVRETEISCPDGALR